MSVRDFNTELLEYIASSPTPFHAASTLSIQLQKAGYQQLQEGHEWELCPGKYYVLRNDSSLIAFSLPDMDLLTEGFRMHIPIVRVSRSSPVQSSIAVAIYSLAQRFMVVYYLIHGLIGICP